jgi:DNA-binding SARP family transcriptional activator/pimeloyl-ACP methyl ester carboxylesterase
LNAAKERTVLAALLARANRVVTAEDLVEALWDDAPPPSAGKVLQTYIHHLRRTVGIQRITTRQGGYALNVQPEEFDAMCFEAWVQEGRLETDQRRAADRFDDALRLWRGDAYEEFLDRPFAIREAGRLDELRLAALETRLELDLSLGRHRDVVIDLEALAAQNPLRERFWAQLMLAYYRSGRQGDALEAYRRAREALTEELGIEPGTELRRLEAAVLRQDPSLDAGPTAAAPETYYAKRGDAHVAYQTIGSGSPDILVAFGIPLSMDTFWDCDVAARFFGRLATGRRLILFDRLGTGLSDPVLDMPGLEEWIEDALVVLDACGSARAVVLGTDIIGGHIAANLAASRPERIAGIVIVNSTPRVSAAIGFSWLDVDRISSADTFAFAAASVKEDQALREWWRRSIRRTLSPSASIRLGATRNQSDVTTVLHEISTPALVLHRRGNPFIPLAEGRAFSELIPGAEFVELEGIDQLIFMGDQDSILAEIERFLTHVT